MALARLAAAPLLQQNAERPREGRDPGPRMIYQLLYTSRSTVPRGHASDIEILSAALTNNRLLDVTGCLLREEQGFCQILEGARETVRGLFEHIRRDPRHFGVTERLNRLVPVRSFASWSMCYGTLSVADRRFLSRRFAAEGRNMSLVIDRVRDIAVAS